MNTGLVVHNKSEKGWFVGWPIEKKLYQIKVKNTSLEKIIAENDILPVDFLKIDAQGCDLDVVKSAGKYLKDIRFIQIEAVSSHDLDVVLYSGQQLMEQDIEDMDKLGFSVLKIVDYSAKASPEADILFYNRSLVSLL